MIRPLKESDIPGLNHLPPTEWNSDYEAFLRKFMPTDFFKAYVLLEDEKIVGTGNVFLKGKIGWLANIIVAEESRGKGYGFEITQFLVDFLWRSGCETQLLIATQLGEPVYTKIGFKKITTYQSYQSEGDYAIQLNLAIRKLENVDLESVYQLDQLANGENRSHLIDLAFKTGFGYFNDNAELIGFYLPDFGRGLVLSTDNTAGIELLKFKHATSGKTTLLPVENEAGIHYFEENGFKKGVNCSKMVLGKENKWQPNLIFSYGSGYCG